MPESNAVIPTLPTPPQDPNGIREEHVLGQYIPLEYHYHMLQDEDRVGAFRDAIEHCVRPGMHVVELGGGTGILSSLAAWCGAQVVCVERNPALVACSRKFIRENALTSQITVIQADAAQYVPDQKVDVVICEMLHVGLLREKQAQVISAFKRNYRHKFGSALPTFIPEASVLMCQLVQQSFDFAGFWAAVPLFQAPLAAQPRTIELSPLSPYANLSYGETIPLEFDVRQSVTIGHKGTMNAVRFVTQNVLAIDLPNQRAITWPNQCLVLPTSTTEEVAAGDTVEIKFAYQAGGAIADLMSSIAVCPVAPASIVRTGAKAA